MKKVLLHICCGVCAFACIERLKEEGFCVDTFFFNPNIHPKDEYTKRVSAANIAADMLSIKMIQGRYDAGSWFSICEKYKNSEEGGMRCSLCIEHRLKETFKFCKEKEFDYFTTTLTISPHKNSKKIIELAERIGGDYFLAIDFKKNDGFKKSMQAAKQHNLYRQNYCGCMYSK